MWLPWRLFFCGFGSWNGSHHIFSRGTHFKSEEWCGPSTSKAAFCNFLIVAGCFQVPYSRVCLLFSDSNGEGVRAWSWGLRHSASDVASAGFGLWHLDHEFKEKSETLDTGLHTCHPCSPEAEIGGQQVPSDPVSENRTKQTTTKACHVTLMLP